MGTNYMEKLVNFQVSSSFSLKDKIFFFRELSYLLEWWISIPVALTTIQENTENDKLQYICEEISKFVRQWEPISKSLTRISEFFNEWDINIIRSWEWTWQLPKVLLYLAEEYERLYDIKLKFVWAMLYPMILIVIVILAIYIIFAAILPWFINILSWFPASDIPYSTQLLINFDLWLQNNFATLLFWLFIIIVMLVFFISTEEWREWYESKILRFPIVWKIIRLYLLVKFLRYLQLLLKSWISIVWVFRYLQDIMNNSIYKKMCAKVLNNLNNWDSVIPVLRNNKVIIPSDVVVLLKVWEETANIPKATNNAIVLYEQEFNKIVDNLSKIIEPILIILIWWLVGIVALAIFSVIVSVIWNVEKM